jgi:hypothetical protein
VIVLDSDSHVCMCTCMLTHPLLFTTLQWKGAASETYSADIFASGQAVYINTAFDCDIRLRLKGQVSSAASECSEVCIYLPNMLSFLSHTLSLNQHSHPLPHSYSHSNVRTHR